MVVGTPGRVSDLVDQGELVLSNVSFATLDEADDMLRVGCVAHPACTRACVGVSVCECGIVGV